MPRLPPACPLPHGDVCQQGGVRVAAGGGGCRLVGAGHAKFIEES